MVYLDLGLAGRDSLGLVNGEEDLGDEVSLDFFLFCFLGALGRLLERISLTMSDLAFGSVN